MGRKLDFGITMSQNIYSQLAEKRILIAGAGVTGVASARALMKRDAEVTLVDEKISEYEDLHVITPAQVTMTDFDFFLVSPGWREDHPLVKSAREEGVLLINEIDLAWNLKNPAQKWLALTGTNGKTTTVELCAHMLRTGGVSALACGNVGTTVIEAVQSAENYEYLVLELSSFQLHWLQEAHFVASSILNIA
jgi:UDP-N-acetylmuramoylalanine--D-glutamate ligase